MGKLLNIVNQLHTRTKRNYLDRMNDDKAACMKVAKEYGADYWDGDRRYGYGGYTYDGRWEVVARNLIEVYNLPDNAKILDVGCGKGFLLYEFRNLLPESEVTGFDISGHAVAHAKEEIKDNIFLYKAQDPFPYGDNEFDLVISLTTLHNLHLFELKSSIRQIERVGKNKYIVVEGYRNEEELFNLQCWALTCESFFKPQEWIWLFNEFGYTGDYEFIYF